ncbi:hypothetical protein HDU98_002530 [Podochytrium sp. JEL0797]|nr:hypothetical protein HDU98_002530 [Podochytrium sp. JEL0797]
MQPTFRYKTLPILTFRETVYLRVMNEILIKPDWWLKLVDPSIAVKWRAEIANGIQTLLSASDFSAPDPLPPIEGEERVHVTDSEFVSQAVTFMFSELNFLAAHRLIRPDPNHRNIIISPTSTHGVFVSDTIVSSALVSRLSHHASAVEHAALQKHKWHPQSDNKVLDLIHPSDYCLVFGKSKLRNSPTCLVGDTPVSYDGLEQKPQVHAWEEDHSDVSTKFQWIPAEFNISKEGQVTVESYINNLHRASHPELTGSISAIFAHMVPMFELALGPLSTTPLTRIHASMSNNDYQAGDIYDWQTDEWVKHKYGPESDIHDEKLRDYDEFEDEYYEFADTLQARPIAVPGLPDAFPADEVTNLECRTMSLKGKTVQVIVKMANILLTPERPTFNGGSWHLEGMENEAIAATGILYYDVDNITSSRLAFRHVYDTDDGMSFEYEQGDFAGLEKVFGFSNDHDEFSANVAVTGKIEAKPNRCIVFPNFLHHKVEAFELADKSRAGSRKILAFFVVHPEHRILSSKDVAKQQTDWVANELFVAVFRALNVPVEIVRKIVGFTGSTMSPKEAEEVARQVMEERKNTPQGGYANVQNISLCEH